MHPAITAPSNLEAQLDSIRQPSALMAVARIKAIESNADGYSPPQLLEIFEQALTVEVRSKPQRRCVIQALKQALKRLPARHVGQDPSIPSVSSPPAKSPKPVKSPPPNLQLIPAPKAILSDASQALEKLRSVIVRHEESFTAATLGPRLQIGLQCLKAHQVFCIPDPKKSGALKGKKALTRERLSTGSFKDWLAVEAQWLKESTAYKYMTAVRGLGLDHSATAQQVAAALKLLLRKGPVTIAGLCAVSLAHLAPPAPEPPQLQQQEFEFLRQNLSEFREQSENICRLKTQLDAYPDFKRAATSRVYSMLYELTGTHWAPSDEPDALAAIDPDAITI